MSSNSAAEKFKNKKVKPMSEFDKTTSAAAGLESSVRGLGVPSFGASLNLSNNENSDAENIDPVNNYEDLHDEFDEEELEYDEYKINAEQNNILITFTELNPKVLRSGKDGFNLNDKKDIYIYNRIWTEVTEELNAAGEPFKTTAEWKKVTFTHI